MKTYEDLVSQATEAPVEGQDLAVLDGRLTEPDAPWSYPERASELVRTAGGPVLEASADNPELAGAAPDGWPFPAGRFALVLSRHERYHAPEVRRVLAAGGVFLTEQIGGLDGLAINEALDAPLPADDAGWSLGTARSELEAAGFEVSYARTAFPERVFHDVGALVYFLRVFPRQVPDFSVEAYDKQLRALHDQMSAGEPLRDRAVRFLIEAATA